MKQINEYSISDLITALKKIGIKKGDTIFSHVGLGFLGFPEGNKNLTYAFEILCEAVWSVIEKNGTWLVPTYSYSF